ncbi:GDYXXLXY domain-containing protein [Limoniibacter endophyticus]|uniref:Membrane protein n=1 Tax=Limoniibacter endophyticus TaxID=1565040 RepID=A0A8J3GFL0_9HYPH|nr:GDYXXLXY domain-containing protein [Limoniibacter endophyticus]GHC67572.1 membrane protein [Limoniibacter endophyticus]
MILHQKRTGLFVIAGIMAMFQSGFLLASIQQRADVLRNGAEIVLQTAPVDPRDLLRGDYVTLGYDITRIELSRVEGSKENTRRNQPVRVFVQTGSDGVASFTRASFDSTAMPREGEIMLLGTARSIGSTTLLINYGIERYYVPEGKGLAIEHAQREQRVDAVIAVSNGGKAQIKALRIDSKTIFEEPLY